MQPRGAQTPETLTPSSLIVAVSATAVGGVLTVSLSMIVPVPESDEFEVVPAVTVAVSVKVSVPS